MAAEGPGRPTHDVSTACSVRGHMCIVKSCHAWVRLHLIVVCERSCNSSCAQIQQCGLQLEFSRAQLQPKLRLCASADATAVARRFSSAASNRVLRECSFKSSAARVLRKCNFSSSRARQLHLELALRKFGRNPGSVQGLRDRECSAKAAHVRGQCEGTTSAAQVQRKRSACAARVQHRCSARAAKVQRMYSASASQVPQRKWSASGARAERKCSASAAQMSCTGVARVRQK